MLEAGMTYYVNENRLTPSFLYGLDNLRLS